MSANHAFRYYAHGWHLGLTSKPLLDEQVQAWSFGPVIRSLYTEFKEFGAGPISSHALTYSSGETPFQVTAHIDDSGLPDTPWDQVRQQYGGQIPKHTTIPEAWIRDHFRPKESTA